MYYNLNNHRPREYWWFLTIAVIAGLVVIVIGGYLVWKATHLDDSKKRETKSSELPRMTNQPPPKKEPKPVKPPYSSDAPLLEQVREALSEGINPESAVALAKSLPNKPEKADAAFILLEYAAEVGNAEAALEVGRYFDPTFKGESGTIIKDPYSAYEWYQLAFSKGRQEAQNHLSELRQWVEKQAAQGSKEARELLNSWR
ncbi:hypothetical protein ACFL0M_10675 [Thermodesulfobacteriota bacterium]